MHTSLAHPHELQLPRWCHVSSRPVGSRHVAEVSTAAKRAGQQARPRETVVGIDLGTTNSAVAYIEAGGKPRCIPNEEGSKTTPSVVAFLPEGEVTVGNRAKREANRHPGTTYSSTKRLIGRKFDDPVVQQEQPRLPFQVLSGEKGEVCLKCDVVGRGFIYPEEVSAQVLVQLLDDAERFTGGEVRKAIISVPAYFNTKQREATANAGALAGLGVVRLIREPVAAALAYGLNLKEDQTVLVFDLGGGTYDISLLEVGNGTIEVLSTGVSCLSLMPVGGPGGGPQSVQFTRKRLEELSVDLWRRCRLPLDQACWAAGVDLNAIVGEAAEKRDELRKRGVPAWKTETLTPIIKPRSRPPLSKVLLVGGATRMPAVSQFIKNMTGIEPEQGVVNPDEAVALGAAVQAGVLQGEVKDLMIIDQWQAAILAQQNEDNAKQFDSGCPGLQNTCIMDPAAILAQLDEENAAEDAAEAAQAAAATMAESESLGTRKGTQSSRGDMSRTESGKGSRGSSEEGDGSGTSQGGSRSDDAVEGSEPQRLRRQRRRTAIRTKRVGSLGGAVAGSGVYKPGSDTAAPSQHLQLHIKTNGHGPTNTITRAELVGILVALQHEQTEIATDSASCLSQISNQTLHPIRMRYLLHAELIHAISTMLEHSPHPIHFY
ncbi:Hsp70 protein-domain-containing protein [Dunaliella salina]|uniref:Hsp70 protein-domain-containing protein n=1 Tax=Dunaliella salina TaxID=3046 RepID=A0ABQ7GJU9_DUNSA|nr:Hsp70 protein-domain-containing protein [Dunaliella salina]|eukprot:KAF5834867.1 Hsp70 protein-domain-containing protein [Dunaliella salina]